MENIMGVVIAIISVTQAWSIYTLNRIDDRLNKIDQRCFEWHRNGK